MEKKRLLLVGLGMVGHRFCERLCESDESRQWDLTVLGEELGMPYDRVHLSRFFEKDGAAELQLATPDWYAERGIQLHLGVRVIGIDRTRQELMSSDGRSFAYDALVLATGSFPFVPRMSGTDLPGVFVYRTLDDLAAIKAYSQSCRRAAVIGGGLLGLEAAKALQDLGMETTVVEAAERLMPRQLDKPGAAMLQLSIEALGVRVLTAQKSTAISGARRVEALRFDDGQHLLSDMIVISAGIRPRDELAREAGLVLGPRGGIAVDEGLATSDPKIFAIGECAAFGEQIYGLVTPGYKMAEVLVARLCGQEKSFVGADLSTRLKVLGIEVASIGDPLQEGDGLGTYVSEQVDLGIYRKLLYERSGRRLLGAILVGDCRAYNELYSLIHQGQAIHEEVERHFIRREATASAAPEASSATLICSCENVSRGSICATIQGGAWELKDVQKACRAGTGCGSCIPLLKDILNEEKRKGGVAVDLSLCEHFPWTRTELYQLIKAGRIKTFEDLIAGHGKGLGCEICKPTAASIFASLWNEHILAKPVAALQDTNDRYLANIQKNGTYSIVPRVPAGEITPEKLMVIAQVAQRYSLYTKITGGQRVDLFGARLEQLPAIWTELVEAGFESGHAYGKSVRTVKSCVGSTWCRYGVQDSVAMAIRIEERYKGIRSPHKIKFAVSGCARECAEAQSKDVGVIATENGWNLYVCGNGGMKPKHAQLLGTDLDDESLIRFIDRFLIYYIRTADRLQRTATWLEKLPDGLLHLQKVIVEDAFGLGADMEREMADLVASFRCEWKATLEDPEKLRAFRSFINTDEADPSIQFIPERGQLRPMETAHA